MFARGRSLDDVRFGRFENLVDETIRLLADFQYEVTGEMAATLSGLRNPNPTNHDHYSKYYDDELRALVARQDRLIIERFGYTFEAGTTV